MGGECVWPKLTFADQKVIMDYRESFPKQYLLRDRVAEFPRFGGKGT